MSTYPINKIEGIGPAMKEKLAAASITNTKHLLEKCGSPKGRKEVSAATGLDEKQLLKWANMADLMRIKGVGEEFSELLEASGVDTVKELKTRRADALTAKMAEVNGAKKLVRRVPTLNEVTSWIAMAATLEPKITH
jgi:predicted flap endonuclease-1-like 5' DNA nuclease